MSWHSNSDIWSLLGAIIVSTISGFISISRRIVSGHKVSVLWVISEFFTAILCGYLMYTAYPYIVDSVPKWFTLPIAIAIASHTGGRIFQELENQLTGKYLSFFKSKR